MKDKIAVFIITFIVSFAFMAIGIFIFIPSYNLITKGELVKGKIVGVKTYNKNTIKRYNDPVTYSPVIAYKCGEENIEQAPNSSSSFYPNVGEEIEIYCNKSNPHDFIINSFIDKYFGLIFFTVGFLILIIFILSEVFGIFNK